MRHSNSKKRSRYESHLSLHVPQGFDFYRFIDTVLFWKIFVDILIEKSPRVKPKKKQHAFGAPLLTPSILPHVRLHYFDVWANGSVTWQRKKKTTWTSAIYRHIYGPVVERFSSQYTIWECFVVFLVVSQTHECWGQPLRIEVVIDHSPLASGNSKSLQQPVNLHWIWSILIMIWSNETSGKSLLQVVYQEFMKLRTFIKWTDYDIIIIIIWISVLAPLVAIPMVFCCHIDQSHSWHLHQKTIQRLFLFG